MSLSGTIWDPSVTQYAKPYGTVRCIVEFTLPNGTVKTLIVPNMEKAEMTWDVNTPMMYYLSKAVSEPATATLKVTGELKPLDESGSLYTLVQKDPE